ncbi:retrotransposon ORF1 [Tanacetum coccineum]
MDPKSSLGKICLGEDVVVILSDKVEGYGDWNSPEFQDTTNSGQKKETKAMVFYQMETEEVSDRFVAPCFVNGLEAYDGEINLGVEENMISNEYAVKLCLEHEVKRVNKVVKKELILALRGEIYFVKFIINPEEDEVEPGVIFGRSFLRMTKAITDFEVGTITIYPDIDPFLEETEDEGKSNDDRDHLLDFNIDDIPLLGEEGLPPFVCKIGKSSRNKKRAMENLNFFYQDIGTSSSAGGHLTQEEAAKEAIAIRMSRKFALLEEERPIIETMAYHDKYKKILDDVWKDKVELDGKIVKEDEEAVKRIKGEALKEKDDPGEFIFPIRLEGQVNENALVDTGSDINTMPYRIYEQLGRENMKKVDRGITMINHTQAEAMGILTNVLCQVGVTTLIAKFLILDILIDRDSPIVIDFMRNAKSDSDDKEDYQIKRNKFGAPIYGPKPVPYLNCNDPDERSLAIQTVAWDVDLMKDMLLRVAWIRDFNINEPIYTELCHEFYSTYEFDEVCVDDELQTKKIIRSHTSTIKKPVLRVIHKMITYGLCQRTTGYDKIKKNDLWLLSMFHAKHQNGYANVAWVIAGWVLIEDMVRSLSALIYCRDLDTTILRDLIDSDGKLIPKDPQPGVPRVGIPRPPRASMQDLYDRMGRMEIHQEAIGRMEYRQSYHWDRYQGVFEHMAEVYSVPMQGAYNPPGMLSRSMTSVINSTRLRHQSINNSSRMMMSSVETTRVGCVTACFGSLMF